MRTISFSLLKKPTCIKLISTSKYLDYLLNINDIHFEQIIANSYPGNFFYDKVDSSHSETLFLELLYEYLLYNKIKVITNEMTLILIR